MLSTKKSFVLQNPPPPDKKTNHCSIHLNPLLHTCHPLKCTFLALTRNGLVPAAAAVHLLVVVVCFLCGQWSGTPSNQLERNLQKNGKMDVTNYPLFYSFIDIITVYYTGYIK